MEWERVDAMVRRLVLLACLRFAKHLPENDDAVSGSRLATATIHL
jgi:hypothetical protein